MNFNAASLSRSSLSTMSGPAGLIPNGTNFTILIWCRPTLFTLNDTLISKNANGFDYTANIDGSGNLRFYYAAGPNLSWGALTLNAWNQLVITQSGTTVSGYLNKVFQSSATTTGPVNATVFGLGYDPTFTPRNSTARYSECAIWQGTVLTQAQINALFNIGPNAGVSLSSFSPAPTTYWNFAGITAGTYVDQIGSNPLTVANVSTVNDSPIVQNYLTVNGIQIAPDLAAGYARADIELGGDHHRGLDGTPLADTRGFKTEFTETAVLDTQANSQALEKLLAGEWDHWSFSSLISDWGQNTSSSSGATTTLASGPLGVNANQLSLVATTGTITWQQIISNQSGATYSVLVWQKAGGNWHWFAVVVNAGVCTQVVEDGLTQAAVLPSWLSASTTNLAITIANTTGAAVNYYDLVVLPFAMPTSWATQFFSYQGVSPWPTTPGVLQQQGLSGSLQVRGDAFSAEVKQSAVGGAWNTASEKLAHKLRGV